MPEVTTLESALSTTPSTTGLKVEKSFLQKKQEIENKPIPTDVPKELLSTDPTPDTLQSVGLEAAQTITPSEEQKEQIEDAKVEAKVELDEVKSEAKDAIASGDENFLNDVMRKIMDDRERLTYRNIEVESENKILLEKVQELQKQIYSYKYDDERLPVHEKSRSFYLTEYEFFNNPDDVNKKEKYVSRLKERLEQVAGVDLGNIRQSDQNLASISKLSESKTTPAPIVANQTGIPTRGLKVKRTLY